MPNSHNHSRDLFHLHTQGMPRPLHNLQPIILPALHRNLYNILPLRELFLPGRLRNDILHLRRDAVPLGSPRDTHAHRLSDRHHRRGAVLDVRPPRVPQSRHHQVSMWLRGCCAHCDGELCVRWDMSWGVHGDELRV